MKIKSARITKMPKKMGDKMPNVYVTLTNGKEEFLFTYYPDEISFTKEEFIGLTVEEARHLKFVKDKAYLTSDDDAYSKTGKVIYQSGGSLVGKRVKLIFMHDPNPVEPDTLGTIDHVDGIGQLHVKWDNGRRIAIIPEIDQFEIVENMGSGGSTREMRPSPTDSATMYPQGFRKRGNDGNIWEIALTSAGIHRWVKSRSSSPSSEQEPAPKREETLYNKVYNLLKEYPDIDYNIGELKKRIKSSESDIKFTLDSLFRDKKITEEVSTTRGMIYKYKSPESDSSSEDKKDSKSWVAKVFDYVKMMESAYLESIITYFAKKDNAPKKKITNALDILVAQDKIRVTKEDDTLIFYVVKANKGESSIVLRNKIFNYIASKTEGAFAETVINGFVKNKNDREEVGLIYHALGVLVAQGKLVEDRKKGSTIFYSLAKDEDTSEKGKLIKRLNELALDNFVVSVAFITNKDMGELHHKAQSEAGRKQITEEVAGFILGSKNKDVYLAELKRYKVGGNTQSGWKYSIGGL